MSADKLLSFLGKESLEGMDFLDIGSGSGLHSLAAFDAKAKRIHSFDFDPLSVRTTAKLRQLAGDPPNWIVERGDVLDVDYLQRLGTWSLVYSWGVLHHTGAMWQAIENAAHKVAPGGLFFIALYSSNVVKPSAEFWLDVKRRYNAASPGKRRWMEYWYIWRFGLGRNPLQLPQLLKQIYDKKKGRGMSYMTDVRDWLGGWPMEFADDQAVVDFLKERFDFELVRMSTGEACTEFLFQSPNNPPSSRN
ncbi:class I SAM-dependent methyltransferase [Mesorhizobium sp. VK23B]|uniref:Class I SAM-dependent methyltransferase n=1 Tax=Mesorhizobium dulcispinae TaxID=3072316 RepID=A0ABU4XFB7_9HYPH|nr:MULTISPECIES: class I SAM-dependent methyltransferase [unclassified Mesorhizobium]MDX8466847.1 class I SAM-dependent methyltransferase [Mesorhizobium sp. VK23B]MDX8473470.1 class I SAM-dependent methyltransferase [Mesorhizobium sp. VK23A]